MKKYIMFFAAAALMVSACTKEQDYRPAEPKHGTCTVDGSEQITALVSDKAGEVSFTIQSSEAWRVAGNSDWITPSKTSGQNGETLKFTFTENDGMDKEATYKVFAADATAQITFQQEAKKYVTLVDAEATEYTTSSNAGEIKVKLYSNLNEFNCDFGGADWVELGGVESFNGKQILTFNVKRSSNIKDRSANVKISGTNIETPVNVEFVQAQRDTVIVTSTQSVITNLDAQDVTYTFQSNVDYSYGLPSWLAKVESEKSEIDPETNLCTETLKVHADATGGSRAARVNFLYKGATMNFIYFKQQNPNPVFANIQGKELKEALTNNGWILEDPETGKCEVLQAGLEGTSLSLGGTSSYTFVTYESMAGLGAFPKLATLTFTNFFCPSIDLSDCKALTSWNATNVSTGYLDFGDNEITTVTATKVTGYYFYGNYPEIVIKGSKIQNLDASIKSYYITSDLSKTMDVTGCPALTSINCKRINYYGNDVDNITNLYVTAAQNAAIEGGTLTVTKCAGTEITVK